MTTDNPSCCVRGWEEVNTGTYSPATQAADARRETVRRAHAEVRAVEANRVARFHPERGCFTVRSASDPLRSYEVRAQGEDGLVRFSCTCAAGTCRPPEPGSVSCWHAAKVARRLSRERLIQWDGKQWVLR